MLTHKKSIGYDLGPVFNPAASIFVSANAGAGKTSLLTRRVLSLLLTGSPPSKILCLTFTNAAAAEMMNRVQSELGKWVMAGDAELIETLTELMGCIPDARAMRRARSLFAQVLEAEGGMRIQTIHGFCQSLLKRFPVEAGVSPHFTVMDARSEQAMLQEARQRLFAQAQKEDIELRNALAAIAQSVGESSFHALVGDIIQQKRRFRALFTSPNGAAAAIARVWQRFALAPETTAESLVEKHFIYDKDTLAVLRQITALLLEGSATDCNTGQGLARWLEQPVKDSAAVAGYVSVMMTDKGRPRAQKNLFTKKVFADLAHAEALLAEQRRVCTYCNEVRALEAAERTVHMLHIAEALLALYDTQKRAWALMDFDDLILAACALLNQPDIAPWVLFKLDGGIDHVLVDEAQDTSPEQWMIVDKLTEEFFAGEGRSDQQRSLFVVGDEKQSIYRFQGADPAALAQMRDYFSERIEAAAQAVHHVALEHSFRSVPQILQAVDAVFAQPEVRIGLTSGEAALNHVPTRLAHPGLVELWPLVTPDGQGLAPATLLARRIADSIAGWLSEGVSAGDIMILVRTRTALVDRLVRALKKRDIPVAGQDRMQLSDNLAVQDLIALGQCLLLPEDDLTLAALLKSPMFDISEEELFHLAWQREGTLWERLRERAAESEACKHAYALLSDLRARADYIAPYELYAYALDTLGARQRFTGRMGEEYHDPIDEFLGQALLYERSHPPSLQGFLHWLMASDSEIKRDMEQAQGAVRILTVHGAKGLQAPIVILPDTVEPPKLKDRLLWGGGLPFWMKSEGEDDSLLAQLRAGEKAAMQAEQRRLMYVAMTRAEDRLYICGATAREKANEKSWYDTMAEGLKTLAQPFDMPWGQGLRLGCHPERSEKLRAVENEAALEDGDFNFLDQPPPNEPNPPQPLAPSRLTGDEPAAASPLAPGATYLRGNLIHALLQYLPAIALSNRADAGRRLTARYGQGLPQDARDECLQEALAVINDAQFAFLFASDALAEVPVAGCVRIGGKTVSVNGQIDRLYVGEGEVWIVDFKSNRQPPENTAIPAAYLRQMRLYQLLLEEIYPGKTIRCALLWTATAKITEISQGQLDEVPASSYI